MQWTDSVKLQLIREFIVAYRQRHKIQVGTELRGRFESEVLEFIECLAHSPEYDWTWQQLKESDKKVDVEWTKIILRVIPNFLAYDPALVRLLPPDYSGRLAKKLEPKSATASV